MKNTFLLLFAAIALLLSCQPTPKQDAQQAEEPKEEVTTAPQTPADNTLTAEEKAEGWQLLFDGKNIEHWRVYKRDTMSGWTVKDGEMIAEGKESADIISKEKFENFELQVDWKVSEGGNSGIFFNVVEEKQYGAVYETGPEYQIVDDYGFPEPLEPWQQAAANYGMHPASKKVSKGANEYNSSRIRVENGHVTHWLNDEKVVEYDLWTPEWETKVKESKWKDYPAYGRAKSGHLGLQDHGNMIWFKNIKVKRL